MELSKLNYKQGSRGHKEKVYGRGFGNGGTGGFRGQNLAHKTRQGFEGNQTVIYRKVRKIGFNNKEFANNYNVVTLEQIEKLGLPTVDYAALVAAKLIKDNNLPVKVIGNEINKAVVIKANKFTAGAAKAITDKGGKIEAV
jgi:large subunit ribosomal protein L15